MRKFVDHCTFSLEGFGDQLPCFSNFLFYNLFLSYLLQAISYGINLIDQNRLIQLIKDQSSALMNDRNLEKERTEHSTQVIAITSRYFFWIYVFDLALIRSPPYDSEDRLVIFD